MLHDVSTYFVKLPLIFQSSVKEEFSIDKEDIRKESISILAGM